MNLQNLAKLIGKKAPDVPLRRLVIDSRSITAGDCFVAIRGARFDGEDFISDAFARGASCCISRNPHPRGLCVEDTVEALQAMAQKQLEGISIYAITGAMGKTTTKHFVNTLMQGRFPVTPNNYNTQISLPLAALNELGEAKEIFLEMGMTESGNLKRLVEIAPPKVAMITYLPKVIEDYIHAASFTSIEELICAKYEIFRSPKLELALVPDDLPEPRTDAEIRRFSLTNKEADYALIGDKYYEKGEHLLTLPLDFPSHHVRNFLAGIAYARALGASLEQIQERAPLFELPPMRFEKIEAGGVEVISDAYNASPEAMIAAFDALPKGKKKIALLGEMLMLGPYARVGHAKVLKAAQKSFDHVLCYGKTWEVETCPREELVEMICALAGPGDLVYVKGSRDLGLEGVVKDLVEALEAGVVK